MSCPRGPVSADAFLRGHILVIEHHTGCDDTLHESISLVDDEVLVRGDMSNDLTAIILIDDSRCVAQPHGVSCPKGRTRVEFHRPRGRGCNRDVICEEDACLDNRHLTRVDLEGSGGVEIVS